LHHGLSLLRKDTDVNRRLAMINIDNAVELMIKTYLGLPKRVTNITLGRDRFREISESFPRLLDALEEHAADKLDGIDLGEIEWYHRLRNELYHQGNGLTVEREKVEVYAELSRLLFKNLFGVEIGVKEGEGTEILGEFMQAWLGLEQVIESMVNVVHKGDQFPRTGVSSQLFRKFFADHGVSLEVVGEYDRLRQIRNGVVHGVVDYKKAVTPNVVESVRKLTEKLREAPLPSDVTD
jgi:hypothetical protein